MPTITARPRHPVQKPKYGPGGYAQTHPVPWVGSPNYLFTQNFENGILGQAVTAANSGGGTNHAFSSVTETAVAGQLLNYDAQHAHSGTQSLKVVNVLAGDKSYVQWNASVYTCNNYYRAYFFFPQFSPGVTYQPIIGNNPTASVTFRVLLTSTGVLSVEDSTNTVIYTFNTAIPTGSWFRLEGVAQGTANGFLGLSLFVSNADGVVPDESFYLPANVTTFFSNEIQIGVPQGASAPIAPFWVDDIGFTSTGYLGPAGGTASSIYRAYAQPIRPGTNQNGSPRYRQKIVPRQSLPSTNWSHNFEGTPLGNVPTVANSTTTGNNAFTSAALAVYDDGHTHSGAMALKAGVTNTLALQYVQWTVGSGSTTYWFRAYYYIPQTLKNSMTLIAGYGKTGTTCFFMNVQASTMVPYFDDSTTVLQIFTNPVPIASWFRLEGYYTGSNPGQINLQLFNSPESTVPTEQYTLQTTHNTTSGEAVEFRFGAVSAIQDPPYWVDDVAISTSGYIGPIASGYTGGDRNHNTYWPINPGAAWLSHFRRHPWTLSNHVSPVVVGSVTLSTTLSTSIAGTAGGDGKSVAESATVAINLGATCSGTSSRQVSVVASFALEASSVGSKRETATANALFALTGVSAGYKSESQSASAQFAVATSVTGYKSIAETVPVVITFEATATGTSLQVIAAVIGFTATCVGTAVMAPTITLTGALGAGAANAYLYFTPGENTYNFEPFTLQCDAFGNFNSDALLIYGYWTIEFYGIQDVAPVEYTVYLTAANGSTQDLSSLFT